MTEFTIGFDGEMYGVYADGGLIGMTWNQQEAERIIAALALSEAVSCPVGHVCANFPLHAQAKIIRQRMDLEAASDREQRLRTALEWYARGSTYEVVTSMAPNAREIFEDLGERARAALSEPGPAGPGRGAGGEVQTNRGKYPGYDLHSYHAYRPGPEPGCNTSYGAGVLCSATVEDHCNCPVHLAQTAAYAEPAPTGPERGKEANRED